MNLDAELQGLVHEAEPELLPFARKLYEYGYRQGLAARPPGSMADIEPPSAAPPVEPAPLGPLFPARAKPTTVEVDEEEEDGPTEDSASDDEEVQACDHRVRASITVAGLQKKIERLFDLSRFDIEVVICRRGDPDRRRLKNTVRLGKYVHDGE
jgi:hypothetical protein